MARGLMAAPSPIFLLDLHGVFEGGCLCLFAHLSISSFPFCSLPFFHLSARPRKLRKMKP